MQYYYEYNIRWCRPILYILIIDQKVLSFPHYILIVCMQAV
jgi:hypothetical protein